VRATAINPGRQKEIPGSNKLLLKAREIGTDAVTHESQATAKGGPMVLRDVLLAQDTHSLKKLFA
jgi:hypothetical protein